MDDKNRLDDGGKLQTPAGRVVKARRRIFLGITMGALLVTGLITGDICLSGRQGDTSTAPGPGTTTIQQEQVEDEKSYEHDWTVTHKTVHRDAATHTENVPPICEAKTSYHTACNDCQQTIDGAADAHIKDTSHFDYSTNVPITGEALVSEDFTREVTNPLAYNESIPDKLVCTPYGGEEPAAAEQWTSPFQDPAFCNRGAGSFS